MFCSVPVKKIQNKIIAHLKSYLHHLEAKFHLKT